VSTSYVTEVCDKADQQSGPPRIFLGARHQEALQLLERGLTEGQPLIALTGPAGSGKTTILGAVMSGSLERRVVWIDDPRQGPLSLCRALGGLAAPRIVYKDEPTDGACSLVRAPGQRAVVVIDDAHMMQPETLQFLSMLASEESGASAPVQVLLVGRPAFWGLLADCDLGPLRERIAVHIKLDRLPSEEANGYIEHLLGAGGAAPHLITKEAADDIVGLCEGNPRRIASMVTTALAASALEGGGRITRRSINRIVAGRPSWASVEAWITGFWGRITCGIAAALAASVVVAWLMAMASEGTNPIPSAATDLADAPGSEATSSASGRALDLAPGATQRRPINEEDASSTQLEPTDTQSLPRGHERLPDPGSAAALSIPAATPESQPLPARSPQSDSRPAASASEPTRSRAKHHHSERRRRNLLRGAPSPASDALPANEHGNGWRGAPPG
jgi:type II secretory pathway predicted ATPase ExeA